MVHSSQAAQQRIQGEQYFGTEYRTKTEDQPFLTRTGRTDYRPGAVRAAADKQRLY